MTKRFTHAVAFDLDEVRRVEHHFSLSAVARHVEEQLDRLGARINRARRADLRRTLLAATAAEGALARAR